MGHASLQKKSVAEIIAYIALIGNIVLCMVLGSLLSERESMRGHVSHRLMLEEFMVTRIELINEKAPAERIAKAVLNASEKHRADPLLALSVIETESTYNPNAVGLSGERGLMQITKRTAKSLDLPWDDAFDIERNVDAGVRYLAGHVRRIGNKPVLTRYNGGGQGYAAHVMSRYREIGGEN